MVNQAWSFFSYTLASLSCAAAMSPHVGMRTWEGVEAGLGGHMGWGGGGGGASAAGGYTLPGKKNNKKTKNPCRGSACLFTDRRREVRAGLCCTQDVDFLLGGCSSHTTSAFICFNGPIFIVVCLWNIGDLLHLLSYVYSPIIVYNLRS